MCALVINPNVDIILCHQLDEPYMREYVASIAGSAPIVRYCMPCPAFVDRGKRYICIRRVPFAILPPETDTPLVFVNTEQLSVPSKWAEYGMFVSSPRVGSVYDYSLENVKIGNGRSARLRATHLPLVESADETARLKAYLAEYRARPTNPDPVAQIACVGTPTQYRIDIISGLFARGVMVDFIQGFGEPRDRRVAACKLLLNLHAGEAYRLWEPLRCARWMFAGLPIASEPCDDEMPEGIHITPVTDLDALAAMLREILATLS